LGIPQAPEAMRPAARVPIVQALKVMNVASPLISNDLDSLPAFLSAEVIRHSLLIIRDLLIVR
jgi:hypothetical protein